MRKEKSALPPDWNWPTTTLRTTSKHGGSVHHYDIYLELQRVRGTENNKEWVFNMLRCPLLRGLHAVSTPPVGTFDDKQVIPMMEEALAQSGTPLLSRSTILLYLGEHYGQKTDEDEVKSMIEMLYRGSRPVRSHDEAKQVFIAWRRQHQIPSTPKRLTNVKATEKFVGKWPTIHANVPSDITKWFNTYKGKPFDRSGDYRTLVVYGGGSLGKTKYIQSFGKHIYFRGSVSLEALYDCIRDGEALYIVLDDVPWPILLKIYHFLLSAQPDFSFKQGRTQMTTEQPLPVVVLNNDPPSKFYHPHDAKYWRRFLRYVEVEKVLMLKPPGEVKREEEEMKGVKDAPQVKADVGVDVDAMQVEADVGDDVAKVDAPQVEVDVGVAVDAMQVEEVKADVGDVQVEEVKADVGDDVKADVGDDVDAVAEMGRRVSPPTPPDSMRADITAALGDLRTRFPTAQRIEHRNEDGSVVLLGWYIPNFFTKEEADAYLHALQHEMTKHWLHRKDLTVAFRDMKGNVIGVTRDKAVFCTSSDAAPHLRSLYRYNSPELSQATPMSQAPVVDSIRQTLVDRLRLRLNHCVANWFRGKQRGDKSKGDRMGAHSDTDRDFLEGSPILTATLCQPDGERAIQFTKHAHQGGMTAVSRKTGKRSQKKTMVKGSKTSFTAEHGSVYLINYDINHTQEDGTVWKHEVIERKGESGDRFGLTYRGIGTCWDISTGEIANVKGKHEQAAPLNLVDETGEPVMYEGLRWAPTDHPVQVQVDEEQTGKKQSAKRKRVDSDGENE